MEKKVTNVQNFYSIAHLEYTDKTFTKVKGSTIILRRQKGKTLEYCTAYLDVIEKKSKRTVNRQLGDGNYISRTKYSVCFMTDGGNYEETFIVDSEGERLKEE